METKQELMDRIVKKGFGENAEAIMPIIARNEIAVVVFELDPANWSAARDFGWDGKSPVFKMSKSLIKNFARGIRANFPDDKATPRWLENGRFGRIFLLIHHGTLLVNFDPESGYSLEPGSDDPNWMN